LDAGAVCVKKCIAEHGARSGKSDPHIWRRSNTGERCLFPAAREMVPCVALGAHLGIAFLALIAAVIATLLAILAMIEVFP
jgi:hypothetical protein